MLYILAFKKILLCKLIIAIPIISRKRLRYIKYSFSNKLIQHKRKSSFISYFYFISLFFILRREKISRAKFLCQDIFLLIILYSDYKNILQEFLSFFFFFTVKSIYFLEYFEFLFSKPLRYKIVQTLQPNKSIIPIRRSSSKNYFLFQY